MTIQEIHSLARHLPLSEFENLIRQRLGDTPTTAESAYEFRVSFEAYLKSMDKSEILMQAFRAHVRMCNCVLAYLKLTIQEIRSINYKDILSIDLGEFKNVRTCGKATVIELKKLQDNIKNN